ncbi:glyoxalase [Stenotrophomonas panacihumi]|uniref:Glyoxalase n=1 Tax=Stenotrophomonas panacihumi TaxID=676599 RepID=A0A0R0ASL7_9GAMM|nr:VOC family protein [Stenotrophomonas panacihumi]KRG48069.1 glyoxalase [Stenotrophomonas panacihumi]PTN54416.1 VOC family protein [Stenotrophomonas panacihumi]
MTTSDRHHRIDYLEFAVASIPAACRFFGDAFGWTFQDYGPDYCEFRDGRLTGGFFHGTPQPGGALVVIYSDDLAATQAAVERAGGTVMKPVFDFPGGRRFHFRDPDGYEWAAWTTA